MYFFVLAVLLFNTIRNESFKRQCFNKTAYWLEFLLLFLLSGLRYRIGLDSTVSYAEAFLYYPTHIKDIFHYDYESDPGWVLLNVFCKGIINDFVLVQLVQSCFVNGVIFWFVRKYSPRPFLTILLYFLTFWLQVNYEALREGVAVGFYLIALDAIFSGKSYWIYYIRVWPALLFHSFGFLTLFWPVIGLIQPNKKFIYLIIPMVAVVSLCLGSQLGETLLPYVMSMDGDTALRLATYFQSDVYGVNNWSINGIISMVGGTIIPIIWCMKVLLGGENLQISKQYFPFLVMALVISLLMFNMPIFVRLKNYFYIPLLIAMSYCLDSRYLKMHVVSLSKLVISVFVLAVFLGLHSNDGESGVPAMYRYYPYNSIITKNYNVLTERIFSFYQ